MINFIAQLGRGVGGVMNIFYQSARSSLDVVMKNVIPFMIFISMIIGFINASSIGQFIAEGVTGLSGSITGLLLMAVIGGLPFLSPLLGPGAVMAQVIGTLIGVQIGNGSIDPALALPALFAINAQVGCDFIPVGLSLGDAQSETVDVGIPAVLFSRVITGPIAVIIAWLFSFNLY